MIPEQATRFKCKRFAVSSLDDHTISRGQKANGMRCKRPSYCDALHSLALGKGSLPLFVLRSMQ